MKKSFFLFIALTLGIGAWAQTQSVNYIDANGRSQRVTATVITNSASILEAGWYVVLGNNVQTNTLTCRGAVNLILADGAKLTATGNNQRSTPGIEVSGEDKSLVIYGQTAQTGQLFANGGLLGAGIGGKVEYSGSNITINGGTVTATGGEDAAGIGGGSGSSGSNITINGGTVTATGGRRAAGIGGGSFGSGSYITINGGTVTANGGDAGAGIGGGNNGSGSNIKVSISLLVQTDMPDNSLSTILPHLSDEDIASKLAGKRNTTVMMDPLFNHKRSAMSEIEAAVLGTHNDNVEAIATSAKSVIYAASNISIIDDIKTRVLAAIASAKAILGPLGEEHPGPAVKVTKGDTEVILYLPDKVEYIIRK